MGLLADSESAHLNLCNSMEGNKVNMKEDPAAVNASNVSGSFTSRGQIGHGLGFWANRLAGREPPVTIKIEDDDCSSVAAPQVSRDNALPAAKDVNPGSVDRASIAVQTDRHMLQTTVTSLVKLRMMQFKTAMKSDDAFERMLETKFKKLREENSALKSLATELQDRLSKVEDANRKLSSRLQAEQGRPDVMEATTTTVEGTSHCNIVNQPILASRIAPESSHVPLLQHQVAQPPAALTLASPSVSLSYLPWTRYMSAPLPARYPFETPQYVVQQPTQQSVPNQHLLIQGRTPIFAAVPASNEIVVIPNNTHVVHANLSPRMTSLSASSQPVLPQQSLVPSRAIMLSDPAVQYNAAVRKGVPAGSIAWPNGPSQVALPYPSLPRLRANISASSSGIILTWDYDSQDVGAKYSVECYHLFAHQARDSCFSAPTDMRAWKKIGVVNALPLPMACTMTQFATGNVYHFAVLAVDICGREGPLSNPCTIRLNLNK